MIGMVLAASGVAESVFVWILVLALLVLGSFFEAVHSALGVASQLGVKALVDEESDKGRAKTRGSRLQQLFSDPLAPQSVRFYSLVASMGAVIAAVVQLSSGLSAGWLWLFGPLVAAVSALVEWLLATIIVGGEPERFIYAVGPLVRVLNLFVHPFVRLLYWPARMVGRRRGMELGAESTSTEVRRLIDKASHADSMEEEEVHLLHSVFQFSETVVSEVMVPRPDMVYLHIDTTVDEAVQTAVEKGLSRLPVIAESIDDVVGFLYVKDLLKLFAEDRSVNSISSLLRPVRFVPEQKHTADMLTDMRRDKFHIAIVVDEYGGTAGLVTMEDLLEELVGEITDEYDADEQLVEYLGRGHWRVRGRLSLDELTELVGVEIDVEDANTVGGAVLALLGRIPEEGASVVDPDSGIKFTAVRVEGNRIEDVEVLFSAAETGDTPVAPREEQSPPEAPSPPQLPDPKVSFSKRDTTIHGDRRSRNRITPKTLSERGGGTREK